MIKLLEQKTPRISGHSALQSHSGTVLISTNQIQKMPRM
jgi:hypothetical protein